MKPVIEIKHLYKKYRLGQNFGYLSLRDTITDYLKKPLNIIHPSPKLRKNEFWALRDITFSVNQGEAVGIIGGNGAGKSTLLKVLSRITPPTKGEAVIRGRMASLLEVGTGFHPELTAMENIYLNGAIMGMKHREVKRKMTEIIAFAEVEKFIDTPMKHFSSGMYTRLAFAVAAHLDPELLLIDEVLAVGDINFQKKSLGKMNQVINDQGRTILFVSHNLGIIQSLCQRCLLIENGRAVMFDQTDKVVKHYLNTNSSNQAIFKYRADTTKNIQIRKVTVKNRKNITTTELDVLQPFSVTVDYDVHKINTGAHIAIAFTDLKDNYLFFTSDLDNKNNHLQVRKPGSYQATYSYVPVGKINLNQGAVYLRVTAGIPDGATFDEITNIKVNIHDNAQQPRLLRNGARPGIFISTSTWTTIRVSKK